MAQESHLSIQSLDSVPGDSISFEYQPAVEPPSEHDIWLWGVLRTPTSGLYAARPRPSLLVKLDRDDSGEFHGRVELPDSVVYAAFVVGNRDASWMDANRSATWEWLAVTSDGDPRASALWQRIDELRSRHWEEAYASVQLLTELYPHHPDGWGLLISFSQEIAGGSDLSRLQRSVTDMFDRLDEEYRGERSGADVTAGMLWLARGLDHPAEEFWRNRLLTEYPSHPLAIQDQIVFDLLPTYEDRPQDLLRILEEQWDAVGPKHRWQGVAGFRAAKDIGDPRALRRWSDRYLEFHPDDSVRVFVELGQFERLRPFAMDRLRAAASTLQESRPKGNLMESAATRRRAHEAELRSALYGLSRILLAEGDTAAAVDTMVTAAYIGWSMEILSEAAELLLSSGDTTGAVPLLARLSVDPRISPEDKSYVRGVGSGSEGSDRWAHERRSAQAALRKFIRSARISKPLAGPLFLLDQDGSRVDFLRIVGERPTIVVFWSPQCGPARRMLPRIESLMADVEESGGSIVTIVKDAQGTELTEFLEVHDYTFPVYQDATGDLSRQFEQSGTPAIFLVDQSGHIMVEYGHLEDMILHLWELDAAQR